MSQISNLPATCPGCGAPPDPVPRCSYCGRLREAVPAPSGDLFDRRPDPYLVKNDDLRAFLLRNRYSSVGDYERLRMQRAQQCNAVEARKHFLDTYGQIIGTRATSTILARLLAGWKGML